MGDTFEIIKCICGQKNRRPLNVTKPGEFRCGKCGTPLLWIVSSNDAPKATMRRGWKEAASVVAVLALIGAAAIYFNARARTPSLQQAANSATPAAAVPTKPANPSVPVAQRTPIPLPTLAGPGIATIPAPTPDPTVGRPAPVSTPVSRSTRSRELEMVAPAPGCMEKFPTYSSLSDFCATTDKDDCAKKPLCSFTTLSRGRERCLPQPGLYVPTPESDPASVPPGGVMPMLMEIAEPVTTVELSETLARADRFASNRNFSKAITEYDRVLRAQADFPQALMGRAIAYELSGEKTKAVADYCRILIVGSSKSRRTSVRQRIAQLTGQAQVAAAGSATAPPQQLKIEPTPGTGDLVRSYRKNAIAPFKIETEPGANYLVKLVNVADPKDQVLIYVRGGETYSTKMHLGRFQFRAATGDTWYGRTDLFGPRTSFFRLQAKADARNQDTQLLKFYREGNRIGGTTISLKKVADGNLQQEATSRTEFEAD